MRVWRWRLTAVKCTSTPTRDLGGRKRGDVEGFLKTTEEASVTTHSHTHADTHADTHARISRRTGKPQTSQRKTAGPEEPDKSHRRGNKRQEEGTAIRANGA